MYQAVERIGTMQYLVYFVVKMCFTIYIFWHHNNLIDKLHAYVIDKYLLKIFRYDLTNFQQRAKFDKAFSYWIESKKSSTMIKAYLDSLKHVFESNNSSSMWS